MDLDFKIIEGVGQYPSLYKNNYNLSERNKAWAELAEKLAMHEQYIKIRWHVLLEWYRRDTNFKYASRMHFVHHNNERKNKENWPEFIITEECLRKDDNPDEQEQFVYLDSNSECDSKNRRISTDQSITEGKIIEEVVLSTQSDVVGSTSSHNSKERSTNIVTSIVEEKMAAVDMNENNETNIGTTNEISPEKSQALITERCEDVIFGELVSAMLKRMDETKKKNIKREIMNILFS